MAVRFRVGTDPLCGARDEIGHHCVDGNPPPGNEYAGLASCAEVSIPALSAHRGFKTERGVLLSDGAVGSDCQEAIATTFGALARRKCAIGDAHVVKAAPVALGCSSDCRNSLKCHMEAGGDIESGLQRLNDAAHPAFLEDAARIGYGDNHGFGPLGFRVARRHVIQVDIGLAPAEPPLADAPAFAPVCDTGCCLDSQVVGRVSEEQKKGRFNSIAVPFYAIAISRTNGLTICCPQHDDVSMNSGRVVSMTAHLACLSP